MQHYTENVIFYDKNKIYEKSSIFFCTFRARGKVRWMISCDLHSLHFDTPPKYEPLESVSRSLCDREEGFGATAVAFIEWAVCSVRASLSFSTNARYSGQLSVTQSRHVWTGIRNLIVVSSTEFRSPRKDSPRPFLIFELLKDEQKRRVPRNTDETWAITYVLRLMLADKHYRVQIEWILDPSDYLV